MLYRSAIPKDANALKALAVAAYGRLKTELTPANWSKMETLLNSEETFPLMLQTCSGYVCEAKQRLLGMAFLVPSGNPTKIYSDATAYIRMVGVHPAAGGKGIAQTLTRLCIDRAVETREKMISLHSAEIMYAARHIYEKLGFRKIRLLDEHYGIKYWLYEMYL